MKKSSTSTVVLALAALLLIALAVRSEAGPFIYVGNTGEDTMSKIDASNNTEAARIATWFTAGTNHVPPRPVGQTDGGPCPSRIAKDSAGNIYVLDRFFPAYAPNRPPAPPVPPNHLPVLLKIAPTAVGPVAPLLDNNPTNNHIDPAEITDTRILWAKEIGTPGTDEGALGRALCTDTTGNLWVGMYHTEQYYKVDAATGAVIGGPVKTLGHKPYGCQVDVNGKLWSTDADHTLAEIDTKTSTLVKVRDHTSNGQSYALSLYNDCKSTPAKVMVYLSERRLGKTYIAYDSQADAFSNPSLPVPQFVSWSVAVDSKGNIFSGEFSTGRVIKADPAGASVFDTSTSGPTQSTTNLHGLIVDNNDDVWAVHLAGDRLVKYSSANLSFIGPIVPVGRMPYTYGNSPPATCSDPTTDTTPPSCAPVTDKEIRCEPNGGYSYTFTVTNNAGSDMSQILLTPLPGSTFTLSQELFNLPAPLHNGESTTLTVGIGPGKPGEKICFFLSLMSDKAACCMVKVCPKLPKCPDSTYTPPGPGPLPTVKKRR